MTISYFLVGPQGSICSYFLLEYKILSLLNNQDYFRLCFLPWYNMNSKIVHLTSSNNSCGWHVWFEYHEIIRLGYVLSWILVVYVATIFYCLSTSLYPSTKSACRCDVGDMQKHLKFLSNGEEIGSGAVLVSQSHSAWLMGTWSKTEVPGHCHSTPDLQ